MKLEANKRYIRREGTVTLNPLKQTGRLRYPFECEYHSYRPDGRYSYIETGHRLDLISEYVEPSEYLDNVPALDADIVRVYEARIADKDAEIERLKAESIDAWRERERLRANAEGLEDHIKLWGEYYREVCLERDPLRARVEEVEAELNISEWRLDLACKERDLLRTRADEQECQLQTYETQLTLQEDGPKSLLERLEKQKSDLDYYANENAQLRARVQELETSTDLTISAADDLDKLNDELQQRVEELEGEVAKGAYHAANFSLLQQRDKLRLERDNLRARVGELKTYYNDKILELKELLHVRETELQDSLAAVKHLTQPKLVKQTWQHLFDTETQEDIPTTRKNPDGTTFVECELEPIEGEKK